MHGSRVPADRGCLPRCDGEEMHRLSIKSASIIVELHLHCMVEKESPTNTDRIILLDGKRIACRIPKWTKKMQNQTLPGLHKDSAGFTHVASFLSLLVSIHVTKRQVTPEHGGMVKALQYARKEISMSVNNGLTSYGDAGFSRFTRMAFARNTGFSPEDYERPIIGVCDTTSEVNRCHTHFGPIIDALKRSVLMEGGVPLTFPKTDSIQDE